MRTKTGLVGVVLVLVGAACASGGGGGASGGGSSGGSAQEQTRNANIITAEELNAEPASNLYEAIQRLRPQMLVARTSGSSSSGGAGRRGGSSSAAVNVYRDNTKLGDVNTLKDIDIRGIKEVHYYSPQDAETKFSTSNPGGVIQVVTK